MPNGVLPTEGVDALEMGYSPCELIARRISSLRSATVRAATTVAPYALMKASIASGTSCSVKMTHGRPARAAYAATEAPWLPVETAVVARAPSRRAAAVATAQSRSLWDQVGLLASFLAHSCGTPSRSPADSSLVIGVHPSPRSTRSFSSTGRSAWKSHMLRPGAFSSARRASSGSSGTSHRRFTRTPSSAQQRAHPPRRSSRAAYAARHRGHRTDSANGMTTLRPLTRARDRG